MMNSAPAVVGASDGLAAFRSIIAKRGPALAWARGATLRFSSRGALLGTVSSNIVVSVSVTTVFNAVPVREVESLDEGFLPVLPLPVIIYGTHDDHGSVPVPVRPVLFKDRVDLLSDVFIEIAHIFVSSKRGNARSLSVVRNVAQ